MSNKKILRFKDYLMAISKLKKVGDDLENIDKDLGSQFSKMDVSNVDENNHGRTNINEKGMSNDEIDELINKAEDVAQDILQDKKRKKDERDDAKEVIKWISGVRKTFNEKGSVHPNTVNSLMRITAMHQGRYGYINPDNPKIPDDYAK